MTEVVVHGAATAFAQEIRVGNHVLRADEPVSAGGSDAGPTPYDLLLAALGSCTSMTLGIYSRRKKWPLESVTVRLSHSRIHAEDCAECETKEGRLDHIDVVIEVTGDLTEDQRRRLIEIAEKCPVHRTLQSEIVIRTRIA